MSESSIIQCLVDVVNERLKQINFYREEPMSYREEQERARGWLREALFPSTPRVKDKPVKGAK